MAAQVALIGSPPSRRIFHSRASDSDRVRIASESLAEGEKVSRPKLFLASCAVALVSVAATAPAAPAEPPPQASCLGVLSSFAGQAGIRDQFAPAPGPLELAHAHGDFSYCLELFLTG